MFLFFYASYIIETSFFNFFSMLSALDYAELGLMAHSLIVVVLVIRILAVQKNTGMAIAWLVIMFAVPVVGIIGYMLVGEPTIGRRYQQRSNQAKDLLNKIIAERQSVKFKENNIILPTKYQGLSDLGEVHTGFEVTKGHKMQLFTEVDAVFDKLIGDINHAQKLVLMEFYIIYPKGRVLEVLTALQNAVRRGVECHILADSVGSLGFFSSDEVKALKTAGVYVHQSMPVGLFKTFFKRADVRNHRKIVVIDERVGYTGSFNLVDPRFFKQDKNVGQWVDVMMRVRSYHQNSVVAAMASLVVTDIGAESSTNLAALDEKVKGYTRRLYVNNPAINDVNDKASVLNKPSTYVDELIHIPNQPPEYDVVAQLIPSAPQMTAHVIYNTLVNVIHRADKRICITTPYFVPDEALVGALTTAARRGVEVTIIVPKKVDSFLVQHASQSYYQELLEAGVTLALFDAGLLHAKTVLVDEEYCLFGTVNMDMRSFYLNMEVSLAIYSTEIVTHISQCQQTYLQHCEIINLQNWQCRPSYQRIFDNGIRLFSPLL